MQTITKKDFINNVVKYDNNIAINENIKVITDLKKKGFKTCKNITLDCNWLSIEDKKEFIKQYFNIGLVLFYRGFYFIYK